jgi:alanine dehydrogenase
MLIINNDDVAKVLTMADCIRIQEDAFKKLPFGGAIHRPRIDLYMPCELEDGYYRWSTMEGANDGYMAIRMKSDVILWPKDDNDNWTEEKYCREPGTYCGIIYLLSCRNGEPLAFINDGVLQHMRVGGGAGIGVKWLAREDSHIVGMLGSGGMARTFLEAFTCVRDIRRCKIYSPNAARREACAEEMTKKLNIEVRAVSSAREAVKGVDILSSCTDSMTPVYDADWVEKGMHVTNLGRREMPEAVMTKFDVVVRQGAAGLQMRQTERFQAERGLSPAAYIGGSPEEMKRIPARTRRRVSAATVPSSAIGARAAASRNSPISLPENARAAPRAIKSPSTAMSATRVCSSLAWAVGCTNWPRRAARGARSRPSGSCRI